LELEETGEEEKKLPVRKEVNFMCQCCVIRTEEACECPPTFKRVVLTKEEEIERLKEYKRCLEAEMAGIEEKIIEASKKGGE
jgi:hypothetical protein